MLGNWQLIERIAASEHADLYAARSVQQAADGPADYLVKVVRDDDSAAVAAALLRREVLVAQSMSHPLVAAVLDGDLAHAPPYLVMANSGIPADPSRRHSLRSALWRVRQTASAIGALHKAGWIHSRLTPQALLISARGHVALGELGWSRRIGTEECSGEHLLAADLRYVPPEMLCDTAVLSPACDVYGLGLLLIELLCGRPAVNAEVGWRAALAHLRGELADVRRFRVELPAELVELVARMTSRDPLRRPNAREVERRLARLELRQLSDGPTSRTRWR